MFNSPLESIRPICIIMPPGMTAAKALFRIIPPPTISSILSLWEIEICTRGQPSTIPMAGVMHFFASHVDPCRNPLTIDSGLKRNFRSDRRPAPIDEYGLTCNVIRGSRCKKKGQYAQNASFPISPHDSLPRQLIDDLIIAKKSGGEFRPEKPRSDGIMTAIVDVIFRMLSRQHPLSFL